MNTHTGRLTQEGKEMDYNGWTNWETWHVNVLAENDEPTYRAGLAMAQACLKFKAKGTFDLGRAVLGFKRTFHKAWMETKRFAHNNVLEYGGGWTEAVAPNWQEIAEHWLDKAEEANAYAEKKA